MTTTAIDQGPIYSVLASDPVLSELVEMYVAEMPDRIAAIEHAFAGGDREIMRRAAHQMKGAAGSYGFDCLTQAAAALESAVLSDLAAAKIQRSLEDIVQLCRRIRAGAAN
jgi:HPt (histidine-containing phosphotransfer) domain-containing protein